MPFLPYLHAVAERHNLAAGEACEAMQGILAGEVSASQIAAFLTALRMKGETVEELVGFARAMRAVAVRVDPGLNGEPLLDTCGTGGDGQSTFNISTIAAFVVAGAGVRVAKHGNRSLSSQCGSADLLEALGIAVPAPPELVARAIREVGIGFLFAPAVHTAMKHAQPVRAELKMRTVFNLLGPLTNPRTSPSCASAPAISSAASSEGAPTSCAVAPAGLDEITTTGPTSAFEINGGKVQRRTFVPEDFGTERVDAAALKGGDRETNAAIARAVLGGVAGAQREIVLVNAAAALVVAGKSVDFRQGMQMAGVSIDSGAARKKVDDLARFR